MKFKRVIEDSENIEIEATPEQKQQLLDFLVFAEDCDLVELSLGAIWEELQVVKEKVAAQTCSGDTLFLDKQQIALINLIFTEFRIQHVPLEQTNYPIEIYEQLRDDFLKIVESTFDMKFPV